MIVIRDRVRFVETDTMGVVHHSVYLHWFEMGRVELMRSVGITLTEMMDSGVLFPIAEVEAKYKNSLKYDDEFEVQTKMTVLTRIKMEFETKIIRLRDGAVAAEGKVRNVFTDTEGRVVRLDKGWMERMEKALEVESAEE